MSIEWGRNIINFLQWKRDVSRRRTMRRAIEQDSCDIYHMGASITDIACLGALNADLTCNISDPRNAKYLVPLADVDEEHEAHCMADTMLDAVAALHSDDATFDGDQANEQCLVDARRMAHDPTYMRLFGSG
jgi:hypothetical protein